MALTGRDGSTPFSRIQNVLQSAPLYEGRFVERDTTRDTWATVTEENAALVVAIADAVNRHDLDALMPYLDGDIEHRDSRLPTVRRGREAIRQYFLELWTESPDASFSVDEVVAGGDWVIVRQTWRGLAGGDLVTWVARQFLNRKVRRIDVCATRAEALEAAGLDE